MAESLRPRRGKTRALTAETAAPLLVNSVSTDDCLRLLLYLVSHHSRVQVSQLKLKIADLLGLCSLGLQLSLVLRQELIFGVSQVFKPGQVLFNSHLKVRNVPFPVQDRQVTLFNHIVQTLDDIVLFLDGLLQSNDDIQVMISLRSEVFTDHGILINELFVAQLDGVKLFLELFDVLLLGDLHLAHDLFLSVQLAIQVLCLGHCFVHLVLELQVLLLEDLNLSVCGVKFDLAILNSEHLVLQITSSLQQL